MKKILMVCLGNICRSPLAEGILKAKLRNSNIFVDSAGIGSWHIGQPPDIRSINVAKKNNIDISKQRGRQLRAKDFDDFDCIYVMDNSNYKDVVALARNEQDVSKVLLIMNELFPNENVDVPDPYAGDLQGFSHVFHLLDEATSVIANKLNEIK